MQRSNHRMSRRDERPRSGPWAALLVAMLAGCTTQQAADGAAGRAEPRVVRQFDLPLLPEGQEPGVQVFAGGGVRGTLDASGQWRVRGEISHPRLRCATYRISLGFGSGEGACNAVDWLRPTVPLTSRMHCNNATLIHTGEGALGLPRSVSMP